MFSKNSVQYYKQDTDSIEKISMLIEVWEIIYLMTGSKSKTFQRKP
ncbi:Uncharacterized protein dnm_027240 [Desulfonema magnum]|uniref:Uncharacterized protein n=1 Tax=Desulfonema magnum TaxID=45655 RepID=A0A975GMI6_9BACT|nr:Uncharacterized protein dnm_027240 [Desulfonema magnum]